jgi:tRNA dimethylallyltransferase
MPEADPQIRAQIEHDAEAFGWPYVHQQLADVDPVMAAEIHPNHSQRLSRALEVYRASGKTMSELRRLQAQSKKNQFSERFNLVQIAISPRVRALLHERIALRFRNMIDAGLLEEVHALYNRGDLHADLPAIRAVGYRQVWDFIEGRLSYDEMVERGIIATRQLAKRQFTWLKGWQKYPSTDLNWLYTECDAGIPLSKEEIVRCALNFVSAAAI